MKYCGNCGAELKEGADICLKCGKMVTENKVVTKKYPGKGLSIASLVLGIISSSWALLMLLSLGQAVEEIIVDYYYNETLVFFIAFYIGYTLFSLAPGILSLIFGIKGNKKAKSGMSTAGLVLSIISLSICALVFLVFTLNVF